ncbi:MAG: HAD family hydrolase [Anaerolineales bacterium]|jgi:HAD superfamily hydrolase (TIGR01509 family)
MIYQGIIFDFNGVLWWDGHLQERAWRDFARGHFGISLTNEVMASEVHGRNNRHTLEFLAGTSLTENQVAQLSDQKEAYYQALCLAQGDDFKLSPGAIELLDELTARMIPRTIATASGKENLNFFNKHLHLERWFELEKIVFDNGARPGKPAPDIYLHAAHLLGLHPGECVVVEDSLSGIQAAHSASIGYVIALQAGNDLLSSQGIALLVNNLAEIPWEDLYGISAPEESASQDTLVDHHHQ